MDPLSDVLSLLKPRSYMVRGFDVAGDWSIGFGEHEGIKCFAVVSGGGWMAMEGLAEPVRLQAGDCLLLPRGRPFRLASDLSFPPVDIETVVANAGDDAVIVLGGGGECFGISGWFAFGSHAGVLLSVLPPIVHIRKDSDKAALRWFLSQLMDELREPRPGGLLVA